MISFLLLRLDHAIAKMVLFGHPAHAAQLAAIHFHDRAVTRNYLTVIRAFTPLFG
ncbi:hypothetical protein JW992_04575 [candidate division KSB1 bacterium]|nr:hypothetical protein [candidate division KSB1 bacterium]